MQISIGGPSTLAAAALCALGLTGLVSAVPGAAGSARGPAHTVEAPAPAACGPAAWPYAAACGTAAPARSVRMIAVDAAAGPAAR